MAQFLLYSDTKKAELGSLTPIDLEIHSLIVDLVYLSALVTEYGPGGEKYVYGYGGQIEFLRYENPLEIGAYLKNVSKKTLEGVLNRIFYYEEEKRRRAAEADKAEAEAKQAQEGVMEKKLKNLATGVSLREKMIKSGIDPDEANKVIAGILVDQRAKLTLPPPEKT